MVNDITFSQRIKFLRNERGLSREELANVFDVNFTTIAKWEQAGIIPNGKTLETICDYFHVSLDYLFGRSEIRKITREERRLMEIKVCKNEKPFNCKTISYEDMTPDDIDTGKENDFFITTVLDDAMQPLIYPTDKLLIKRQETFDNGVLVLLTLDKDSEGIVRKLVNTEDGIELHSVNPYYPGKKIEDKNKVKIYGIVKKLIRKF